MRIQLIYTDPSSQTALRPVLETPIAIGSAFSEMPNLLAGDRVSRITLNHPRIAPYHLLLVISQRRLQAIDQNTSAGILVNGQPQQMVYLNEGDRLQVGPCEIQVRIIDPTTTAPTESVSIPANSPSFEASITTAPRQPSPHRLARVSTEGCERRVGFLFPRRCGRLSPAGCSHCDNGRIPDEPYFYWAEERSLYPNYGNYAARGWGHRAYPGAEVDFTEADAASLERLGEDFEQDMGAS